MPKSKRTIEYWDRRPHPQHEQIAVMFAEDITSRFFNDYDPVSIGQLMDCPWRSRGVTVNSAFTLVATRVLDLSESDAR